MSNLKRTQAQGGGRGGGDSFYGSGSRFSWSGFRILKRFRGGLVLKAHRPLCHSTLGSDVIKKKRRSDLTQILLVTKSEKGGAGHLSRSHAPCASQASFRSRTPHFTSHTLLGVFALTLEPPSPTH